MLTLGPDIYQLFIVFCCACSNLNVSHHGNSLVAPPEGVGFSGHADAGLFSQFGYSSSTLVYMEQIQYIHPIVCFLISVCLSLFFLTTESLGKGLSLFQLGNRQAQYIWAFSFLDYMFRLDISPVLVDEWKFNYVKVDQSLMFWKILIFLNVSVMFLLSFWCTIELVTFCWCFLL